MKTCLMLIPTIVLTMLVALGINHQYKKISTGLQRILPPVEVTR